MREKVHLEVASCFGTLNGLKKVYDTLVNILAIGLRGSLECCTFAVSLLNATTLMLQTFIVLTLLVLVVDALGWVRFLWFISIGYGASIAAIAIALGVMHYDTLSLPSALLLLLGVIYGFRLAGYLLVRELSSANYRKTISYDAKQGSDYPLVASVSIWLSCVLLYLCQMTPVIVRVQQEAERLQPSSVVPIGGGLVWAGIAIAALGLLTEAVADQQKNAAKQLAPQRFVDTGLYRIVRCPNYFGEVIFWTGILTSGLGTMDAWWQWLMALTGYVAIVYIMFSGARRLELRQDHNYGDNPEYQAYKRSTPILFPFVPIYSVKRHKWLRG